MLQGQGHNPQPCKPRLLRATPAPAPLLLHSVALGHPAVVALTASPGPSGWARLSDAQRRKRVPELAPPGAVTPEQAKAAGDGAGGVRGEPEAHGTLACADGGQRPCDCCGACASASRSRGTRGLCPEALGSQSSCTAFGDGACGSGVVKGRLFHAVLALLDDEGCPNASIRVVQMARVM
jgi:hypothetical protein